KNPFTIPLVNGGATVAYTNKTGMTIKDFHFKWTVDAGNVKGADELLNRQTQPFFSSYTYTAGQGTYTLDFYDQPIGNGKAGVSIAPNADFGISLSGLTKVQNVSATPTFNGGKGMNSTLPNPEPASFVIL